MSQLSVDFDNNLQRSVTFIYLKGKDYSLLLRGLYFFRNLLFGSNLWYKSIGVTRIFYYCEIFYYSEVYYCEIPLYLAKLVDSLFPLAKSIWRWIWTDLNNNQFLCMMLSRNIHLSFFWRNHITQWEMEARFFPHMYIKLYQRPNGCQGYPEIRNLM